MKEETIWDKIIQILYTPYYNLQWFFAEKWLNETFGKREYWGDEISRMIVSEDKLQN